MSEPPSSFASQAAFCLPFPWGKLFPAFPNPVRIFVSLAKETLTASLETLMLATWPWGWGVKWNYTVSLLKFSPGN